LGIFFDKFRLLVRAEVGTKTGNAKLRIDGAQSDTGFPGGFRLAGKGGRSTGCWPALSAMRASFALCMGRRLRWIRVRVWVGRAGVGLWRCRLKLLMGKCACASSLFRVGRNRLGFSALSVFATTLVVSDGESNWVEGLQLMAVYLILALAFYFIP